MNEVRKAIREIMKDADRLAYFESPWFRGLWFSRRAGKKLWTVTYLNSEGEFEETEEFPTWRAAVDAALMKKSP